MIEDIQVFKVTGEQHYNREEVKSGDPSKGPAPGAMVERTTLYIEARDYNSSAQNYNKYKETLCNFDFFVKHLKRRDGFILDSTLSAPTADPWDPSRQFVVFRLTSHFPEVRRHE